MELQVLHPFCYTLQEEVYQLPVAALRADCKHVGLTQNTRSLFSVFWRLDVGRALGEKLPASGGFRCPLACVAPVSAGHIASSSLCLPCVSLTRTFVKRFRDL